MLQQDNLDTSTEALENPQLDKKCRHMIYILHLSILSVA